MEVEGSADLDETIRKGWSEIMAPPRLRQTIVSDRDVSRQVEPEKHRFAITFFALAATVVVLAAATYWFFGNVVDRDLRVATNGSNDLAPNMVGSNMVDTHDSLEMENGLVSVINPPSTTEDSAVQQRSILVLQPRTSPNFTIVKTYRTINFQPPLNSIFENKNEQTN